MDATTLPSKPAERSGSERAVLLVTSGPRAGVLIDLTSGRKVVLGRAAECDGAFDDPSLSRRHAEIGHAAGAYFIRDLGSRNGTFVNGRRIDFATTLEPDDRVRLGEDLHVRFTVLEPGESDGIVELVRAAEAFRRRFDAPGPKAAENVDDRMQLLLAQARRAAQSDLPVLLLGETGVGKDVLARAIHTSSPRSSRPFVPVNCGALSDSLFEAELFGHERGAFTGAERAREGLIEAAEGGTLFLDEVGELPLGSQVKLLRVLEDRRVTRVGSVKPVRVDVRFIAATNRSLEAEVKAGTFRQDLLFRINAVTLAIPPLRDRRGEVRDLALKFLRDLSDRLGRPVPTLTEESLAALESRDYPGNIRELRNLVEKAAVMAEGDAITVADLGPAPTVTARAPGVNAPLEEELRSIERERILAVLEACGGNQSRAAETLGMPRRTLVKRLGQWGLTRRREG